MLTEGKGLRFGGGTKYIKWPNPIKHLHIFVGKIYSIQVAPRRSAKRGIFIFLI